MNIDLGLFFLGIIIFFGILIYILSQGKKLTSNKSKTHVEKKQ